MMKVYCPIAVVAKCFVEYKDANHFSAVDVKSKCT
jgi:hypothetical protein